MERCLICYTNCDPHPGENESLISKQLETIFILRKLFEVPVTHLEVFLQNKGNPQDWISLCGTCKESTERARKIYEEILETKKKFGEIRKDIAATVRSTFEGSIRKGRKSKIGSSFVSVVDECRRFLKDQKIDEGKHSFADGDQQADEHLNKLKFKSGNILVGPKIEEDLNNIEHSKDQFNSSPIHNSISESTYPEDPDFYPSDNEEHYSIASSGDEESGSTARNVLKTKTTKYDYRKHVGHGQFKCAHCTAAFVRKKTLEAHVKNRHSSSTTSSNGENEKEVVNLEEKNCPHCELTFSSQSLKRHVRHVHANLQQFNFTCPICNHGYLSRHGFNKHISDSHKESDMTDEDKEKIREISSTLAGEAETVMCPFCKKELNILYFYKHIIKDHPDIAWSGPSAVENDAFISLKAKFKEELKRYTKGNYVCHVCGDVFTCKYGLSKHVRFQHEKKFDISCNICGQGMRSDFRLRFHLARTHKIGTVSVKRACTFEGCRRVCWSLQEFEDHLSTHTKTPRYQCNQCGAMSYTKKHLKVHQQTHLANRPRPFSCTICGKSFSRKDYLPYHMKTHDKQTVETISETTSQDLKNISAAGDLYSSEASNEPITI